MGKVAVTVKIFPEDVEKIDEIEKRVREIVEVAKAETEEIGFGLKALKIVFVMGDEGGVDEYEEKIRNLPGVSQAQVEDVRRI